ncbi:SDR family NAD(P)-dependent oxidoreductase [Mesorhizobium sp. ZC-5]|uniref:SDR family NAD(P)-dependent oxidoreductase n=1 Tax=Mesorhizobium sp. ZC-5 TaxID=2986066 RepID=UPI0021E786A0|nr:SDR family NAD(P)-dependent oxidoreductase [Mesorhizobium sp. ZC-5]MCV3241052.1 SDR family NAD(P)-dependent oxidoreductase [Mesorhizobium sp. ZC-5]
MTADNSTLPALAPGRVAVITGAASGIGLAVARQLAAMHMKVVLADRDKAQLDEAAGEVAAIALGGAGEDGDALAVICDVSKPEDLVRLADTAFGRFGEVSFLMNNAGVGNNPGKPWEDREAWRKLIDVNFWGAVHGVEAFVPRMLAQGSAGIVVNTGSKQGITTPPGNLAYNVSKAALKTYTEGLAHELRNAPGANISAHLLIPGFTFTGLTTGATEKPAGAWSGDQVAEFMLESLARGDFYILCPDNEATREMDQRRMAWAIGDIIENRPALSRWHPDHKEAFDAFLKR